MKKFAIGLAVGAVLGAGIGVAVTYVVEKRKFDTLLDEESAKIKAYYKKKYQKVEVEMETVDSKEPEMAVEFEKPVKFDGKKPEFDKHNTDYVGYFDENSEIDSVTGVKIDKNEEILAENDLRKAYEDDRKGQIELISYDDWSEWDGFEEVVWTYFEDECIFLDENEEEVVGAIDSVGGAELLDGAITDDGCIYVRNNLNNTKYQLIYATLDYETYRERYGLDN